MCNLHLQHPVTSMRHARGIMRTNKGGRGRWWWWWRAVRLLPALPRRWPHAGRRRRRRRREGRGGGGAGVPTAYLAGASSSDCVVVYLCVCVCGRYAPGKLFLCDTLASNDRYRVRTSTYISPSIYMLFFLLFFHPSFGCSDAVS